MKVFLGSDHVGLQIKEKVKTFLIGKGFTVEDCGAYTFDKDDDYPDFVGKAAEGVSHDPASFGIVFGGSGQGEAIVANKYKNVRCSLFYAPCIPTQAIDVTGKVSVDRFEMLRLTRVHNDANVLSLGVRFLQEEELMQAITVFLETPFNKEERHARRIEKITKIEEDVMK
ncbi:MAG TPA: RpiB/LacA/LacB family sugar-phosphate isomerase [Methylomirabilota bacterium]|nr:RpiB/LacA/LacB family sugar-phosphate isomerase [Methylomirabilota bacterium]